MELTKKQRFLSGFAGGTAGAFTYKVIDGFMTEGFVFAEQGTQLLMKSLFVALVFGATIGLVNMFFNILPQKKIN
ncbi:MAG TPA: hypothetical protein VIK71_02560 [Flavobacteriales bacterium]